VEWAGLAEAWGDRGHGVTTDSSGFYRMNVGPLGGPGSGAGQFLMRASKTGYVSQEVQATLGEMVVVDFTLSPYHDDLGR
jgi:hypothetical protein